jgi:hypothetical protein
MGDENLQAQYIRTERSAVDHLSGGALLFGDLEDRVSQDLGTCYNKHALLQCLTKLKHQGVVGYFGVEINERTAVRHIPERYKQVQQFFN